MKMPIKIDNIMLATCRVNCMGGCKHLAKKKACNDCNFQDETIVCKNIKH